MDLEQLIQSLRDKMASMAELVRTQDAKCDALKDILAVREQELSDCVKELCEKCRRMVDIDTCRKCRWYPIKRGESR